jgi:hypothetical protein
MTAEARVSRRVRPDCVMTNHDFGHTVAELSYPSPNRGDGPLIVDRPEADAVSAGDWSACARMSDVCVKVYRA